MKYKLIKKYPNSAPLGTVVDNGMMKGHFYDYYSEEKCFSKNEVEENPEFWEPIIEKDYKVLAYVRKEDAPEDFAKKYVRTGAENYFRDESGTQQATISESTIKNSTRILGQPVYKPYTIQRISDGEIFSIGDKISVTLSTEELSEFIFDDKSGAAFI